MLPLDSRPRRSGLTSTILVGVLYFATGYVLAELAGAAPSPSMRFGWRLAGWVVPGIGFAAHLGWQLTRHRGSAGSIALRAALAVALGAGLFAVAATLRRALLKTGDPAAMVAAIALWPILAGVPAFVAGLAVAFVIQRLRPRR